jgi:hypothetical protein
LGCFYDPDGRIEGPDGVEVVFASNEPEKVVYVRLDDRGSHVHDFQYRIRYGNTVMFFVVSDPQAVRDIARFVVPDKPVFLRHVRYDRQGMSWYSLSVDGQQPGASRLRGI